MYPEQDSWAKKHLNEMSVQESLGTPIHGGGSVRGNRGGDTGRGNGGNSDDQGGSAALGSDNSSSQLS